MVDPLTLSKEPIYNPGSLLFPKLQDDFLPIGPLMCDECQQKFATCQCKSCENSKFCDGCFLQVRDITLMLFF